MLDRQTKDQRKILRPVTDLPTKDQAVKENKLHLEKRAAVVKCESESKIFSELKSVRNYLIHNSKPKENTKINDTLKIAKITHSKATETTLETIQSMRSI